MVLGWHTEPGCIQHDVPPADGVYKAYEKCADFFTFGYGSKLGTASTGTHPTYYVVIAVGFIVMVAFLIAWVWLEDRKLRAQAAFLLTSGQAGQIVLRDDVPQPGLGGPA